MKTNRIFIYIIFFLCLLPSALQAQLLKKLGQSVRDVAKEAITNDNSGHTSSSSVASDDHAAGQKEKKFPASDLEKHGITVVHAGSASFEDNEYFTEIYSCITVTDSGFKATAAVYHSTSDELTAGTASGMDIAYIYENGIKTKTITKDKLDDRLTALNTKDDWYATRNIVNSEEEGRYIKKNALNATILFNGKKYGPYTGILQMIVNRDKTKFYAIVYPTLHDAKQQKSYLLFTDGKLKPVPFGGELMANIDFTEGCIILSPVSALASRAAQEEDEQKQAALQQQMMDMEMHHQNENDVLFFSGKALKRVIMDYKWLDRSGNNIFSTKTDPGDGFEAGLYLNGKKIARAWPHEGHAWCNADATNWAYGNMGEVEDLVFKDGTLVHNAYHPRQIAYNGKSYMVWFMYGRRLSDEIVMCSKVL
jgi:hypothetical protein